MSEIQITTEMRRAAQAALAASGIQASGRLVDTVLHAGLASAPSAPKHIAAATLEQPERKLAADARVANATFRRGVPERLVIDAAIRSAALHAEMEALTHEQMVEQERNRRAVWDMIHGPLSETQSPDGCGRCGDACDTNYTKAAAR